MATKVSFDQYGNELLIPVDDGGSGGATALSDLSDVSGIAGAETGQALAFNAENGKWEPKTISGGSGDERRLMRPVNQITAADNGKVYAPEYNTNGFNYDTYPDDLYVVRTTASGMENIAEGKALHTTGFNLSATVENFRPDWAPATDYCFWNNSTPQGVTGTNYSARLNWTLECYTTSARDTGGGRVIDCYDPTLWKRTNVNLKYVSTTVTTVELAITRPEWTTVKFSGNIETKGNNGWFHICLQNNDGIVSLYADGIKLISLDATDSTAVMESCQGVIGFADNGHMRIFSPRINMSRAIYPVEGFTPPKIAYGPGITIRNIDKQLIDVMNPEAVTAIPDGAYVLGWDETNKKFLKIPVNLLNS